MSDRAAAYQPGGRHVLMDLEGVDAALASDVAYLLEHAKAAATQAGAKVIGSHAHSFGPGQGVAGVILLAESHLTFHTWPEHNVATLDAFMCGSCQPELAMELLAMALKAQVSRARVVLRGRVPG